MQNIFEELLDITLGMQSRLYTRNRLGLNHNKEIATELFFIGTNILDIESKIMDFYENKILESESVVFDEQNYKHLLSIYERRNSYNTEVIQKLIIQSSKGKFKNFESVKDILSVENLNNIISK